MALSSAERQRAYISRLKAGLFRLPSLASPSTGEASRNGGQMLLRSF